MLRERWWPWKGRRRTLTLGQATPLGVDFNSPFPPPPPLETSTPPFKTTTTRGKGEGRGVEAEDFNPRIPDDISQD